jgi:hypothetical protein
MYQCVGRVYLLSIEGKADNHLIIIKAAIKIPVFHLYYQATGRNPLRRPAIGACKRLFVYE